MSMPEQLEETTARVTFQIRLPLHMHRKARLLAQQGQRSLNRQIVALIQKGLDAEQGTPTTGETRAG